MDGASSDFYVLIVTLPIELKLGDTAYLTLA